MADTPSFNLFDSFDLEDLEFSLLYPKDSSLPAASSTLNYPIEVKLNDFILNQETLPELDSDELARDLAVSSIFDLNQLSSSANTFQYSNDTNMKISVNSDEIFAGSCSSLEELLFQSKSKKEDEKALSDDDDDRLIIVDDFKAPKKEVETKKQPELPVVQRLSVLKTKPTFENWKLQQITSSVQSSMSSIDLASRTPKPFKRKQDLSTTRPISMAVMHTSQEFNSRDTWKIKQDQDTTPLRARCSSVLGISPSQENFNTPRPKTRQLKFLDELPKTAPIKEVTQVQCEGCGRMFKKINQHKCKGLLRTVSDINLVASAANKARKRVFRPESLVFNELNSKLEVTPILKNFKPKM